MALCLITGASGALGSEVARTLALRGDDVALVDRAQGSARLAQVAASIGSRASAYPLPGPALRADGGELDAVLGDVEKRGPVELAALVAGGWAGGAPVHAEKADTWKTMMESNADTVHAALRALLPGMVARKRGAIVVIGSRNVERPWAGANAAAYTASKSAAIALARAAAAEVLEHGVRINAVLPSTMDTPGNRASMPNADFSRWVATSSVAGVIAFLLSDAARDVSGAVVPVYGLS